MSHISGYTEAQKSVFSFKFLSHNMIQFV